MLNYTGIITKEKKTILQERQRGHGNEAVCIPVTEQECSNQLMCDLLTGCRQGKQHTETWSPIIVFQHDILQKTEGRQACPGVLKKQKSWFLVQILKSRQRTLGEIVREL